MSMIVRKPINRCLSIHIKGNEKRLSVPSVAVRETDEGRQNLIETSLCTLMERRQLISGSFNTGEATLSKNERADVSNEPSNPKHVDICIMRLIVTTCLGVPMDYEVTERTRVNNELAPNIH